MKRAGRFAALVIGIGLVFVSSLHAEISVDRREGARVDTITMSITDGVDPIPKSESWPLFRDVPLDRVLNPNGGDRGDGRPDVAYHPVTGWPVAVWAWNNQTDHDIVISAWTGDRWSDPDFLTSSFENEIDPRIFVEPDGTNHVVWWVSHEDQENRIVLLSRQNAADAWEPEVQINPVGEPGRRPSVVVRSNMIRIAYERDPSVDSDGVAEIVVRRGILGGEFVVDHVEEVLFVPADPALHIRETAAGQPPDLWLDWKHSSDEFGLAEFIDGGWGNKRFHPWPDPSRIGEQITCRTIDSSVGGGGGGPIEVPDGEPVEP
jgi:hypothetical protein